MIFIVKTGDWTVFTGFVGLYGIVLREYCYFSKYVSEDSCTTYAGFYGGSKSEYLKGFILCVGYQAEKLV